VCDPTSKSERLYSLYSRPRPRHATHGICPTTQTTCPSRVVEVAWIWVPSAVCRGVRHIVDGRPIQAINTTMTMHKSPATAGHGCALATPRQQGDTGTRKRTRVRNRRESRISRMAGQGCRMLHLARDAERI
jgi:hypothetical protein